MAGSNGSGVDADRLLTVPELAARLAVPASWVYARVESADCDLPHVRVGRYIRFEPSAIDQYLAGLRRETRAGRP